MILSGRYGTVKWNPDAKGLPASTIEIASLNTWKLSLKSAKEDVTCFGDPNKVYVPGVTDISGTVGGFFNGSELALIAAASVAVPGLLELGHNSMEPTILFSGPAYMDCDIDCTLQAPKVSGTFNAAGAWTLPDTPVPESGPAVFRSITLRGGAATLVYGYRTAATLRNWRIVKTTKGWRLSATVLSSDAYCVRRAPLYFEAPRGDQGRWCWPIAGELRITGTSLEAPLGLPEQ